MGRGVGEGWRDGGNVRAKNEDLKLFFLYEMRKER